MTTSDNDIVDGTDDDDKLKGGTGDDTLSGGLGDDKLIGGDGEDQLIGGEGEDKLIGGDDNDLLDGGADDDWLIGGEGDDILIGREGDDILEGNDGYDTALYSGSLSDYTISLERGGRTVITDNVGSDGTDTLHNIERLEFGDGSSIAVGDGGEAIFFGNDDPSGARTIWTMTPTTGPNGGAIEDHIRVETDPGDNVALFANAEDFIFNAGAAGATLIVAGNFDDTTLAPNTIHFNGGAADDIVDGSALVSAHNIIAEGGAGADSLTGGDGDDNFTGGEGDDLLDGDDGIDTAHYAGGNGGYEIVFEDPFVTVTDIDASDGDEGKDSLINMEFLRLENAGSPVIIDLLAVAGGNFGGFVGSDSDWVVSPGQPAPSGRDYIQVLGLPSNTISLLDGPSDLVFDGGGEANSLTVTGNLNGTSLSTNTIYFNGNGGADQLDASALISPHRIVADGGSGEDDLAGGVGDDALTGGSENDIFRASVGADVLAGGSGSDTVDFNRAGIAAVSADLAAGTALVEMTDTSLHSQTLLSIENILGSAGNDVLKGDHQANRIEGGMGNDILEGRGGNDLLFGGSGFNQALYAGNYIDFSLSLSAGVLTVGDLNPGDGDEGIDQIDFFSVQRLNFGDGSFFDLFGSPSFPYPIINHVVTPRDIGDDPDLIVIHDLGSGRYEAYWSPGPLQFEGVSGTNSLIISGDFNNTDLPVFLPFGFEAASGTNIVDASGLVSAHGVGAVGGTGVDTFLGGAGDDVLRGNGGSDILSGNAGHDWLEGGDESDQLDGGDGNDHLDGGDGDDHLTPGDGDDDVQGGAGYDTVYLPGSWEDYLIETNIRPPSYYTNPANGPSILALDASLFTNDNDMVNVEALRFADGSGFDFDVYEPFDPILFPPTYILEYSFNIHGSDSVAASWYLLDATDHFEVTNSPFSTIAALNIWAADLDAADAVALNFFAGDAGAYLDLSLAQISLLQANNLTVSFVGSDLADQVETSTDALLSGFIRSINAQGMGGDDQLEGSSLADLLDGGDGDDWLYGFEGNDELYGGIDNDMLFGGLDNDQLFGGAGVDYLHGDQGTDRLTGGLGDDFLEGGSGGDFFLFGTDYGVGELDTVLDPNFGDGLLFTSGVVLDTDPVLSTADLFSAGDWHYDDTTDLLSYVDVDLGQKNISIDLGPTLSFTSFGIFLSIDDAIV